MITPHRHKAALTAIHRILVLARFLAYGNESTAKIAKVLDYAEILPTLIAAEEDRTEEFETHLQGLATEFPQGQGILQEFKQSNGK